MEHGDVAAAARRSKDGPVMPRTRESPEDRLRATLPLEATPGQAYVERRGIPLNVAHDAGVRFDPDFGGRPAVVVAMRDNLESLRSLHGRYLHSQRRQNKMLTVGPGGGVVSVLDGWRVGPLIVVEGLFDALSLACCGRSCIATMGRWAPWLPKIAAGRMIWLAFDNGRAGEAEFLRYRRELVHCAGIGRLTPPTRCKDWSTALVKRGPSALRHWIDDRLTEGLLE